MTAPDDAPTAKDERPPVRPSASPLARGLWLVLGLTWVALAAIGVLLPGLPTTPFLILAAACFLRSSPKLHARVLANPTFGPSVRAWQETRTIPAATKWMALGTMACFVGIAVLWAIPAQWPWVRWGVLSAGVVGALYLLRLPTTPPGPSGPAPSA